MVRTGKISGRIVDPNDKSASAGANAMLEWVKSPWGEWGGGTTADAEGRFMFDGVPPGEYRLRANRKSEGRPKTITVEPGETVEVVLDQ
jgi:hypothetical protein